VHGDSESVSSKVLAGAGQLNTALVSRIIFTLLLKH